MSYWVEIDEKKKQGKNALSLLKNIATKGNGIIIRKATSADIEDDTRMVKRMLRARKTGFVNTEKFLAKLNSQL